MQETGLGFHQLNRHNMVNVSQLSFHLEIKFCEKARFSVRGDGHGGGGSAGISPTGCCEDSKFKPQLSLTALGEAQRRQPCLVPQNSLGPA